MPPKPSQQQQQQQGSPPPPSTPTSKSASNASILERALGTNVKQEHHIVSSAVMSATPGQVYWLALSTTSIF